MGGAFFRFGCLASGVTGQTLFAHIYNDLSLGNNLTTIFAAQQGAGEIIYYGQKELIYSGLGCLGEVCRCGKIEVKKNKKYFHLDVPKLISWRIYLQRMNLKK